MNPEYSEKYFDSEFEYRMVSLNIKQFLTKIKEILSDRKPKILTEDEWRN